MDEISNAHLLPGERQRREMVKWIRRQGRWGGREVERDNDLSRDREKGT